MLLISSDTVPETIEIEQIFGLIEVTTPIEISQKNIFRRLTEGQENGHQKAIDNLSAAATSLGGNMVFGIKHSTSIGQFNHGTYLYLTYIGTAAKVQYQRQDGHDMEQSR